MPERNSRERACEKETGREQGEQGWRMQVVCVCVRVGESVCGLWIYRYIQSAYMYWGNFIGIFLRSSREKLRKRFSAYFLMGNFTKRNIIQYCVWTCVCECVSVWVLYAPCVISWGRFLGTATWSVISVLGVSTAYSVFETLRLVAAACARISPKQIQ